MWNPLDTMDKHSLMIDTDERGKRYIMAVIAAYNITFDEADGTAFSVSTLSPIAKQDMAARKGNSRSTVKYRAVGGADALDALGKTTVHGLIFSDILAQPERETTVKGIRDRMAYTDKSVQSTIHRLKKMGLIVPVDIDTNEVIEND